MTKWSEIRKTPRLTDARLAEIVRHAEVGGNISAAMAAELIAEIHLVRTMHRQAEIDLQALQVHTHIDYSGLVVAPSESVIADGTQGMRRGE